ncbi:hypothetical protein BJX64DRAFT_274169 [Aspergillus heterothallicus]
MATNDPLITISMTTSLNERLPADTKNRRVGAIENSAVKSADRNRESEILSQLSKDESRFPGKDFCKRFLTPLEISEPVGTHQCLVTDVRRLNDNELEELINLHLPNNLLRLPPGTQNMSLEQLRARTGKPAKSSSKTKQYTAHTPLLYEPTETWMAAAWSLDEPSSFSAKYSCRSPFESLDVPSNEVTEEHVERLGRLPHRCRCKEKGRRNWLIDDETKDFKELVRKLKQKQKHELGMLGKVLRAIRGLMLALESGAQATDDGIVQCEWTPGRGLPEWQRMQDVASTDTDN